MLKGKTVLITGGTKGIGKAIALAFAEEGANIVLNHRSGCAEELIKEIEGKGAKCIALKADVSCFDACGQMMKDAIDKMGRIDILVNNAGITRDGLIMRMSEEDFDDCININLKGAFNTIRHLSKFMLKQKSGAIINISSVVGVMGNAGQANYAASKAGLLGLTKSIAREFAPKGITCNAIAPGFIETDMTDVLKDNIKEMMIGAIPLKRFGNVSDVAQTAVFLAKSSYITGQVINVDGGMVMN